MLPAASIFLAILSACALLQAQQRAVDLRAADGTLLRTTYFSPGKPGPAVILLHMCDGRDRKAWDNLGRLLAERGLHAIAPDYRGYGESGGGRMDDAPRSEQRHIALNVWPGDLDIVFAYLLSQPGVDRTRVAAVGASCGAGNAVGLAGRHPEITTLVLLAGGETPAREFLPRVPWMPVLAVVAHDDREIPDAAASMKRLLSFSRNGDSRLKEYTTGGHGTDLFRVHPELEPSIADWLVRHLIEKPVQPPRRDHAP